MTGIKYDMKPPEATMEERQIDTSKTRGWEPKNAWLFSVLRVGQKE